jgi:hypothetical protein
MMARAPAAENLAVEIVVAEIVGAETAVRIAHRSIAAGVASFSVRRIVRQNIVLASVYAIRHYCDDASVRKKFLRDLCQR